MIFEWTQPIRVIFARMATGKTSMTKKYTNVVEIGFSEHKFLDYDSKIAEENKGGFTKINPDFEKDFMDAFDLEYGKGNIILLNVQEFVIDELKKRGIDFLFAYRDNWLRITNLCEQRGNPSEFIEKKKDAYFEKNQMMKKQTEFCIKIPDDKFLEDVLIEYNRDNKRINV